MNDGYAKYSSKELLEDDFFIQSMIRPTQESDEFWNSLLADGIIDSDQFNEARHFILLMNRKNKVMSARERNDLWVKIEIKNKKNLRRDLHRKQIYLWGAVACFTVFISAFSLLFLHKTTNNSIDFYDVMAELPETADESKEIQLILADKTIEMEESSVDIELNKDGEILVNSKQMAETDTKPEKKDEQITFNQLIVPMGRHSRLVLPDGTRMHINAGSKVIFPNKFAKKEREIFVNGEVYLEVAHNKKVPFFVRTGNMDVKVLGTTLNVKAYEQDDNQSVVLVSGAVMVHTKDNYEAQLSPNQILDYWEGKCSITAVNALNYVSWIDGYFIYHKEPLKNIMKQISRYYGVEVECDKALSHITCSGKLDLKEDLDKVMNDLSDILSVQINRKENSYLINSNN